MSEPLTLYKLIILYMLEKVDFPLTNAQISGFVLDKGYTNYFHLQQAISELIDSKLIQDKTVRNTSYYEITERGQKTLSYFEDQISDGIKKTSPISSKKIPYVCGKNCLPLPIILKVRQKGIMYAAV